MNRWTKHVPPLACALVATACSAPSGCAGDDTMRPIPAGFDPTVRIENAAAMRITSSGLSFFEQNLGHLAARMLATQENFDNGVLSFPIPAAAVSDTGYSLQICPQGPDVATGRCIAEVDIAAMQLSMSTAAPHQVMISGPVPVRLTQLPIQGTLLGLPVSIDATLSGNGSCDAGAMTFASVDVELELSLELEREPAHGARSGYSKLRVVDLQFDQDQLLSALRACGNGLDAAALNTLKGALGPVLLDGMANGMVTTANEQLCVAANPELDPSCPVGTTSEEGTCRYSDGECASSLVGTDGHLELGALLSSFSPGASAGLDFVVAAGGPTARPDEPSLAFGDLNPVAQGATIGMMGGVEANPLTECVPLAELELPTGIPIPAALHANTIAGWTGAGPHLGLALSERFLNYALGAAHNGGALCLGFSTEQVPQLQSGVASLLLPSLSYLAHRKGTVPIALMLRPQKPPVISFGGGTDQVTDPLVRVKLEQAVLDLYMWSSERFIRVFSAKFDLEVPMGLSVGAEGLTPVIDNLSVQNATVTDSELLRESPPKIAEGLVSVLQGLAGQFLGNLPTIDIGGATAGLGVALELRQEGLVKLTQDDDNFLGIFGALSLDEAQEPLAADTSAVVTAVRKPKEGFSLATANVANRPSATLLASSTLDYGSHRVEYSYRLDRGFWHPWTSSRELIVDDPFLMVQGTHVVFIKSRVAGQPRTEDPTPAQVTLTIDVEAPVVRVLSASQGRARVQAWDNVVGAEGLLARYRLDGAEFSAWLPLAELKVVDVGRSSDLEVEVKDEEGNVGTVQQSLIRGRPDPSLAQSASGCGCSVPGTTNTNGGLSILALGALGAFGLRRRGRVSLVRAARGALGAGLFVGAAGSWTGCNCLDDLDEPAPVDDARPDAGEKACGAWGAEPCIVLTPGLIGSYTSAAAAPDGTLWVSGYNEADWEGDTQYGDLVVGKWNEAEQRMDWQSVDGVPTEPAPDPTIYDTKSWRGGQDSAGDDVGQWTSLALGEGGNPAVAYYDATNKSLKFARYDGELWQISQVYSKRDADSGRYAELLMVDGKPVIAFQRIDKSSGGFATSAVVLASAKNSMPGAESDWLIEEVAVDEQTPCRNHLCPSGQKCVVSTLRCTQTTTCDPKCTSGQACIDGTCEAIYDATKLDTHADAIGNFIAVAREPGENLGMVYYDRIRGNLMQARKQGGAWSTAILDGQSSTTPPKDTGDMGIGATLFIDAEGDWHVAYVDGFKETLRYMLIRGGTQPVAPEVVDRGREVAGVPFEDGFHVVGDDANVLVLPSGEVHISYQDATAGTLRHAVGVPSGDAHNWSLREVEQDGAGGFFSQLMMVGNQLRVVNWWRRGGTQANVRVLVPAL